MTTEEYIKLALDYLADYIEAEYGTVDREDLKQNCTRDSGNVGVAYTTYTDDEIPVQTYVDLFNERIVYTVVDDNGVYRVWSIEAWDTAEEFLDVLKNSCWDDYISPYRDLEEFLEDGNSLEILTPYIFKRETYEVQFTQTHIVEATSQEEAVAKALAAHDPENNYIYVDGNFYC